MTPPTTPDHPYASTALFYDPLTRKDPSPRAQKVQVHLEDDLDDGPADHTLTFALDGKDYEIDLSTTNAQKLREVLRPYAAASRKTTRGGGYRCTRTRPAGSDPDTAKIRAWAKANGHQVFDRGRIHQHIRDAYYTAHN
jgi:hypothetical protein